MAKVSGTLVSTEVVGDREDLTDAIYMISPEATPLMSMIGRDKAENTFHEWQIDTLAAPDGANKRAEGNEASFTTPAQTTRVGNHCQISDKTAIVAGTVEAIKRAGRKKEMGRQMSKRSKELKRDMETILFSNQGADSADPRALGGLEAWLKTNTDFEGTGTDPVYTSVPTDPRNDGVQRAITEDMLKNVISLAWTEGADPSVILAGAFNKVAISAFAGNADKVYNLNSAKPGVIVAAMDVYVSDFGTLKVIPSRWQRSRSVFVLDPSLLSVAYLRGVKTTPLAKTGDAEKRLINVEYTLKVNNEAGLGAIYDLTTS
jgi:hypothetical protein